VRHSPTATFAPTASAQATTWKELAGTWATSPDYWTELSRLYDTILRSAGHAEPDAAVIEECDVAPGTGAADFEGTLATYPLTNAEGTVHTDIAPQVAALVVVARADGHELTGSGYRSPERQIELRRAHCGTSADAIYEMPSSECTPPTARPGSSNHELGLAIDFECHGTLIRTRSGECFAWLAANAPSFGLHNLPSEPWHWSIDGT
jgi:LAS superfamily LD-carboxypeptidase LdcB